MKKKTILIIHALYWFYVINQFLFPLYVGKPEGAEMPGNQYLKEAGIGLFLNVINFYAIYFAFPRITALKNKILLIPALLIMVLGVLLIRLLFDWYLWKYIGQLPESQMQFQWVWVWNELRMTIITGIYAILIHYLISAIEARKIRDELINQRQAGELALLKSQVNPHFLFNTLNNIYSLVYQKSEKAPEAVMKFSAIMRYVLYETNVEKVDIEKEIEYLKSYIELQKLRYKQPGLVSLSIEGNTGAVTVAPMLLIPFVENAFKHGSFMHQPAITILLYTGSDQIRLEVSNYLKKDRQATELESGGIGLFNIRRRLELIYPGKYQLEIKEDEGQFKVKLLIKP
jgi:two-component system, LytTR family, sensor kinase